MILFERRLGVSGGAKPRDGDGDFVSLSILH